MTEQNRSCKLDDVRRSTWNRTSSKRLEQAEDRILKALKSPIEGRYVSIENDQTQIWTISSNLSSNKTPIVLVHGFGGGIALWCWNFDQLAADRPVYAIDLPGFARSSRPKFSRDPQQAEKQFVDMIDQWRSAVGLDRPFTLLGHSFGAFLCAAYALKYPEFVKQLVFVDPWGFARRPENIWQTERFRDAPKWIRVVSPLFTKVSPLSGLRAAGPLGLKLVKRFRSDLKLKFEGLFQDDRILVYLFHCNAQMPSGEKAFGTICDCFAWAKEPIVDRIDLLHDRIPMYFLHGGQSWITPDASQQIQEKRANVFVETIPDAGHHVYADAPSDFENYLKRILVENDLN